MVIQSEFNEQCLIDDEIIIACEQFNHLWNNSFEYTENNCMYASVDYHLDYRSPSVIFRLFSLIQISYTEQKKTCHLNLSL